MSKFLESEKPRQSKFKASSPYFSNAARLDGVYRGRPRSFCLPVEVAEQNLFPEIQKSALNHFAKHKIKWHYGHKGKPTNHLCSSQVCCVNFLFPFADKPDALAEVFCPIFPDLNKMLPVEDDQFVSFEWIGEKNYLNEKISRNGQRTRGALFTSADSIIRFESKNKKQHIVLIEWKYGESYGGTSLKLANNSGTDRTKIYQPLFDRNDCPIKKELLPSFDALFYEPFYQFMRQQFLAHEMEKARELGADVVSVLHIAPAHNEDFRKVTSPELIHLGESATSVWKKLVKPADRFLSVSTEQLFGNLPFERLPEIKAWAEYVQARYDWILE